MLAPVEFLLDRFVYGQMTSRTWTWSRYFEPFLDDRLGQVNADNRRGIRVLRPGRTACPRIRLPLP